jgi:glucose/mannose transport system substrate-binding protein
MPDTGKNAAAIHELLTAGLGGHISRREMLKRATGLGLSAPMIGLLLRSAPVAAQATPSASPAAALPPTDTSLTGNLEIFSWWTSGGEAAALEELFKAYNTSFPNVKITNSAIAGGGGNAAQAVLQTRLAGNNPPDSWQSHIGHELFDGYVAAGYCAPMTSIYQSQGWNDVVPQGLIEQVTKDNDQYAVPVGVHRGNDLWYNKKVLSDAGIKIGDTLSMDDFLSALETLKGKGVVGLGLGDKDPFVDAQTFENSLLGSIGSDNYQKLQTGDLSFDDKSVKDAMTTFGKLLGYINDDHSALTWDGATAKLMEGSVAFNTMGDWAWGEFVKKNLTEEIGWVNYPGTDGSFILVVDCFTLPKGAPHQANAEGWLKVIGSRGAQEAFNPVKGSIPPRTDIDKSKFSVYHQWSIDSFAKDTLLPSMAHGEATTPQFKSTLYDAATAFVTDKDVDTFSSTLASAAQS